MKHILFFLTLIATIFLHHTALFACSTYNPTAVITGYPGTTITFSGTGSYDNDPSTSSGQMMECFYINGYRWYLDGVYKHWGSVYTVTFNLPAGVNSKTYAVKLKVSLPRRSNSVVFVYSNGFFK